MIERVELPGCGLGGWLACNFDGKFLGGNEPIRIGHEVFDSTIGAAGIVADQYAVAAAKFRGMESRLKHVPVQMQHLGVPKGLQVDFPRRKRGDGATVP